MSVERGKWRKEFSILPRVEYVEDLNCCSLEEGKERNSKLARGYEENITQKKNA